jgi:hypothetical protein
MNAKIYWKGALIGTLALPLIATAQSAGSAPSDQNMGNAPAGSDQNQGMNPSAPSDQGTAGQGAMNQGAMGDTTATKEITGTVSSVSKHEVSVNAEDGTKMTLHTDASTKVYKPSGATEKISSLKEGQQIRASYDMKADQPHALRIDVIQAGGGMGTKGGKTGTNPNP